MEQGVQVRVKNYCWKIDESDDFYVHIPLRRYEITLKHRLLAQLGAFSHLLLDAFVQFPDQGADWVQKVTGLTSRQLQPILNRLSGLGILSEDGRLSRRGKQLAAWKHRLHGQCRLIWLDGDYRSHSFCCVGEHSESIVELSEDTKFIVRPWCKDDQKSRDWPSYDWNEDCERQKARILRHPEQYLGIAFETFRDCLQELDFNIREWELEVRYMSDSEFCALKVRVDAEILQPGDAFDFVISSPIVRLETSYHLPDGAPSELEERLPEEQHYTMSFCSAVEGVDYMVDAPISKWVWPTIEAPTHRQAVGFLFQYVAKSTPPDQESIFNRHHVLKDRWSSFGFDWPTLKSSCLAVDGVHPVLSGVPK